MSGGNGGGGLSKDPKLSGNVRVLSPRQHLALVELVQTGSITQAASVAKVDPRSVRRWLALPAVQDKLYALQVGYADSLAARLGGMSHASLDVIEKGLESLDINVALKAATAFLREGRAFLTHAQTEIRLRKLESTLLPEGKAKP